jgi:hypothetical protein
MLGCMLDDCGVGLGVVVPPSPFDMVDWAGRLGILSNPNPNPTYTTMPVTKQPGTWDKIASFFGVNPATGAYTTPYGQTITPGTGATVATTGPSGATVAVSPSGVTASGSISTPMIIAGVGAAAILLILLLKKK